MKELFAQIERGKITRTSLQAFLRPKMAIPSPIQEEKVDPNPYRQFLEAVEFKCLEFHPDIVNDVMELVAPFADPNLDFEFKDLVYSDTEPKNLARQISESVFWRKPTTLVFHHLNARHMREDGRLYRAGPHDWYSPVGVEIENLFSEETKMRQMLDVNFGAGAKAIARNLEHSLLIGRGADSDLKAGNGRFEKTRACYYEVMDDRDAWVIQHSIIAAIQKCIAFLAVGDLERGTKLKPFLEIQRSGTPIVWVGAQGKQLHVLCGPYSYDGRAQTTVKV